MASSIILALDLGTTATKGLLVCGDVVLARSSAGYPLHTTASGRAEQDPEQIVAAVRQVVRDLQQQKPGGVDALVFSAAMHALILLDAKGGALTPSITWADRRADREAAALRALPSGQQLYQRTGTPIHPMAWPAKLQHIARHDADLFSRAATFVGIKEYLLYRLTGEMHCDHSMASATGLFNLERLDWDDEALKLAGVQRYQLPALCPTTACFKLGDQGGALLGLDASTTLVMGASDGCLSNLGAGALDSKVAAMTIGTSGALRTVVPRPQLDARMRTFCYVLTEHHFVTGGAVNGGGMALNWIGDILLPEQNQAAGEALHQRYASLFEAAEAVEPGCNGLLFHPYLSGERAPLWNTDASGSFIGLNMSHKRGHLARAVMEGIILNLYLVLQAMEDSGGKVERILAVGGYLRSAFVRQMLCDIFQRHIEFPEDVESSAIGAARLAALALGEVTSLEHYRHSPNSAESLTPEPRAAAIYRELHCLYGQIPALLAPAYAQIAERTRDE
jgi:gluconokinase